MRRGVGYWVLGRNGDALETLKVASGAFVEFIRARSHFALNETAIARGIFEKLKTDDQVGLASRIGEIECQIANGAFDHVAKLLKAMPKAFAETADYHYFQGRILESEGRHNAAIQSYERTLELHPEHRHAMFRLAFSLDLHGQDEKACEMYERLTKIPPVDVAVVMNLGVFHEDRRDYAKAIACFDAVLRSDPTNARARAYRRDCYASRDEGYDETQERRDDKLQQTLRVPITDFELSVRARNCLTKMNIRSLGDLVRKSEAELLSYKNFGETSLNEIKAILHSKNLRLGMLPAEKMVAPPPELGSVDPNLYGKPILELDLSVRSRRTMEALNIRSVGDLLQHSAEELLAMPNFGQTSLTEIRMKLRGLGVDLRDAKSGGRPYISNAAMAGQPIDDYLAGGVLAGSKPDDSDLDDSDLEDSDLEDIEDENFDDEEDADLEPDEDGGGSNDER